MTLQLRISFAIMAVLLVLIGWLHLGTLVLTSLFGYFALQKFSVGNRRWLGMTLYVIAVVIMSVGAYQFGKRAYKQLPQIVESTMPHIVEYANQHQIELPVTDYATLKEYVKEHVLAGAKEDLGGFGRAVRRATFEAVSLLIGLFVAASLFLNARWGTDDPTTARDSLYATVVNELGQRFLTFYASFSRVIGAQIIISAINTTLTAVFVLWNHFNFSTVLIALTFICGLLPIVGNVISNTFIVFAAFTISPRLALVALIYLVVIHKLEYFLNSKIIGDRIKNPMWLTLLGIVLGEKLMGVPGMILAPVVLHYIKAEASKAKVAVEAGKA